MHVLCRITRASRNSLMELIPFVLLDDGALLTLLLLHSIPFPLDCTISTAASFVSAGVVAVLDAPLEGGGGSGSCTTTSFESVENLEKDRTNIKWCCFVAELNTDEDFSRSAGVC